MRKKENISPRNHEGDPQVVQFSGGEPSIHWSSSAVLGSEKVAREFAFSCSGCGLPVGDLVRFEQGDAERLPIPDDSFDAVICECAFCTFPNKRSAAREFARVLHGGGRVGLSDLTLRGPQPQELEGLLAWVACIADARPVAEYARYLEEAGFPAPSVEPYDEALLEMLRDIQGKLQGAELLVKLEKLELAGADFEQARMLARAALDAVRAGILGYALITGQINHA